MKPNQIRRGIISFIKSNKDAIAKYEIECEDTFENNVDEIICLFSKLPDLEDIRSILYRALYNSITNHTPIVDSLDTVITLRNMGVDDSEKSLNSYFDEVNKIYERNHNEYDLVYCEDNMEKLIQMNLKTVISIAKRYQNKGLDLEDLIQAGNEGLVVCAYGDAKTHEPKYDPKRATLRDDMLAELDKLDPDVSIEEVDEAISKWLTYGKLKKKFVEDFPEHDYTRDDVIAWIKRNVQNAKFNSVASMWIRAYILMALNDESRTVKIPKTEIDKEAKETGTYKREDKVDIDAPISSEDSRTYSDMLSEEEQTSSMEVSEAQDTFKQGLNKLLDGVKPRDRAVFLKKFGIGLPRPMLPREIADQEELSVARVSQIFQTVEQQILKNQEKYNIDISSLLEAAKVLR